MGRIGTAFRAFFRSLGDSAVAEQIAAVLDGRAVLPVAAAPAPVATPVRQPPPTKAARSDALTLLSVLQRESRLVDFLKEPIAAYSDAQIGAAVRDVHRDASAALDRLFALVHVNDQAEGAEIEVPAGFDAARIRLTGNVAGSPPHRGRLVHPGWEATKVQLPEWTGSADAAMVVAPAEVELG
jgi:hypothetical protein